VEIAAFLPLSLSDDPGRLSAVVFVAGCNFRCPFCHNPELVLPRAVEAGARIDASHVLAQIERRAGFLDGIVISGGEPTLQPGLEAFAAAVRRIGLRVKLDTNGSRPEVLRRLTDRSLVDYVAMDVKAPIGRYAEFAGVDVEAHALAESIDTIRACAPDYELRTTVAPGLARGDLHSLAHELHGAKRYVLQPFRVPRDKGLVDSAWATRECLSPEELREIWLEIAPSFEAGGVRA
jgi:pyruvate formate lyase activating enzyme